MLSLRLNQLFRNKCTKFRSEINDTQKNTQMISFINRWNFREILSFLSIKLVLKNTAHATTKIVEMINHTDYKRTKNHQLK